MPGKQESTKPQSSAPGVDPPEWHRLHLWQIQPIRDALLVAAVIGLIVLGYRLSIVTVPLLLALLLAYLFEPVVMRVTRRRLVSRQGAALGILLIASLAIVTPVVFGGGFAIVQGINYARSVVNNVQALKRSVDDPDNEQALSGLPDGGWRKMREFIVEAQREDERRAALKEAEVVDESPLQETKSAIQQIAAWGFHWVQANADRIAGTLGREAIGTGADAARAAIRTVTSVGFLVFFCFLTGFFFFFFCTGYGSVLAFWEGLIPERRKAKAFNLLGQMDRVIAGFVRGRLTICLCLMVYFTIAYSVIGTPASLIIGPIVGLLSLLPYVAGLGMPLSMLLMWLEPTTASWQSQWWWIVGGPILVTTGAQILDDYILTPAIQGKSTGMDTPTIVFASIAGGALGGVYGLLLAIPVTACIKILLKAVVWPRFNKWAAGERADPLPLGDLTDTQP
jgi:predicted PurR-regulated permease PerM